MDNKNKPNENRYQRSDGDTDTGDTNSYQATRADKKEQEKKSAQEGVQKGAKTAGAAAGAYFGGSAGAKVGAKVGEAVGKSKLGKKIGEKVSKNPLARKALAKANDSGAIDAANKVTDIATSDSKDAAKNGLSADKIAKGKEGLGQSSSEGMDGGGTSGSGLSGLPFPSKPKFLDDGDDKNDGEQSNNFLGNASGNVVVKAAIMLLAPFFGGLLFIIMIIALITEGGFASYEDAFGVSAATGGETGNIDYNSSDPQAQAFYDRVNSVKQSYQAMGKSINALYISGVYNQLRIHADFKYKDMTTAVIQTIADAMFNGNSFSKETFRQNLTSSIFPTYVPGKTLAAYKNMSDAVFTYVDDYLSLIGQDNSSCAAVGSCIYEIKGFFIEGKGNVSKELSINNLYVRLMQTGFGNGHDYGGTWGQPLADEELVPFEKYVMGVAYQEIGPDAPDEAIKAQLVAARSYILARPFDMGGWRKLEQESDGKWVIQVAASTQDQVYCDPDQGCSAGSGGGQWGMVHSGTSYPIQVKPPLAQDHKLRTLMAAVQGEVLINAQGYIVYAGYASNEQEAFSRLAKQQLNYKQILMQVYNQGSRSYGASDIQKGNCNTGSGGSCGSAGVTGPYAGWKQSDPAWGSIPLGSSSYTISSAGCLVTSVAMLIAKSGVPTTVDGTFNPGTFVKKLNATNGFEGANFRWDISNTAPSFSHVSKLGLAGQTRIQKLNAIKNLIDLGYYVVVEVKGSTGQHWVAVDSVTEFTVNMMDPGSNSTDMWSQYEWYNTSELSYFRVTS